MTGGRIGVLLCGHGSRDAGAVEEFAELAGALPGHLPEGWLVEHGYLEFANPVLREEIAVFLLRAKHGASYQPPPATGMYADVPTGYWAAAWIEQLSREGIGGGCATTPRNYCPKNAVTRDQMAVFLVRAFGL